MVGGQQRPAASNRAGVIPWLFASSFGKPQTLFSLSPAGPHNRNRVGRVFSFFSCFHGGDPYTN